MGFTVRCPREGHSHRWVGIVLGFDVAPLEDGRAEDVLVKPERTLEVLDHLTDVMDACDHRSSVRRDFLWFGTAGLVSNDRREAG